MAALDETSIHPITISAECIHRYAELDLVTLKGLPETLADSFALSIRMQAAYIWHEEALSEALSDEFDSVPEEILDNILDDVVFGFVSQYGSLAFLSPAVVSRIRQWEHPTSSKGPKNLQALGNLLARTAMALKTSTTKRQIPVSFSLARRCFVSELGAVSQELGSLDPPDTPVVAADRLIGAAAKEHNCPRLRYNLTALELFVSRAENQKFAVGLTNYGLRKQHGLTEGPCITPELFFYNWIAWMTNKSPKTVEREINNNLGALRKKIRELTIK